jgi:hypothetical protein
MTAVAAPTEYIRKPTATPMAATTQIVAAVVRPVTCSPSRMMAPAPRKPMPETIWAAMRVMSAPEAAASSREMIANRQDPRQIRMLVRRPAALSLSSRSRPMEAPRARATERLSKSWANGVMAPP